MHKILFVVLSLTVSVAALATEDREAHGDPHIEKVCLKQIRNMDCGSPEDHKVFITCVDLRAEELSEECQLFHRDEVERMKHSH